MAEIIGIVSGLIGISEAGVKISKTLYSLGRSLVKAKDQINDLARELSNISSVFESLAGVLEKCEGLLKPSLLDTAQSILDDCDRTYAEIGKNVSVVEKEILRTKDRAKWPFKKAKVRQLKSRLESAKSTLGLMISILNLSAGIEFLQKHARPSDDLLDGTRKLAEISAESVVEVQLSFDNAVACEKKLTVESSRDSKKIQSSSRKTTTSTALIKVRPITEMAAELPGFQELSLVEIDRLSNNEYESDDDTQDRHSNSKSRVRQISRRAPDIVRELCMYWTKLDQVLHKSPAENERKGKDTQKLITDNFSRLRVADPESEDDYSAADLNEPGRRNQTHPAERPSLTGFSLNPAYGDEPPARSISYGAASSDQYRPSIQPKSEYFSRDDPPILPPHSSPIHQPQDIRRVERDVGREREDIRPTDWNVGPTSRRGKETARSNLPPRVSNHYTNGNYGDFGYDKLQGTETSASDDQNTLDAIWDTLYSSSARPAAPSMPESSRRPSGSGEPNGYQYERKENTLDSTNEGHAFIDMVDRHMNRESEGARKSKFLLPRDDYNDETNHRNDILYLVPLENSETWWISNFPGAILLTFDSFNLMDERITWRDIFNMVLDFYPSRTRRCSLYHNGDRLENTSDPVDSLKLKSGSRIECRIDYDSSPADSSNIPSRRLRNMWSDMVSRAARRGFRAVVWTHNSVNRDNYEYHARYTDPGKRHQKAWGRIRKELRDVNLSRTSPFTAEQRIDRDLKDLFNAPNRHFDIVERFLNRSDILWTDILLQNLDSLDGSMGDETRTRTKRFFLRFTESASRPSGGREISCFRIAWVFGFVDIHIDLPISYSGKA